MNSITAQRKRTRMYNTSGTELPVSIYNLIMGLTVLYGILINILICHYFTGEATAIIQNNSRLFLLIYLGLCLAGCWISYKSDNPFISFLGYNLIVLPMGIVVSAAVGMHYSDVVMDAFKMTASIVIIMIAASCIFPRWFLSLGKALFVSLVTILIVSIAFAFLGISSIVISYISAIIFSLYIGYDLQKAQLYPKTFDNAVDSAIDIYLDIINLFLRLLSILGDKNNNRK